MLGSDALADPGGAPSLLADRSAARRTPSPALHSSAYCAPATPTGRPADGPRGALRRGPGVPRGRAQEHHPPRRRGAPRTGPGAHQGHLSVTRDCQRSHRRGPGRPGQRAARGARTPASHVLSSRISAPRGPGPRASAFYFFFFPNPKAQKLKRPLRLCVWDKATSQPHGPERAPRSASPRPPRRRRRKADVATRVRVHELGLIISTPKQKVSSERRQFTVTAKLTIV